MNTEFIFDFENLVWNEFWRMEYISKQELNPYVRHTKSWKRWQYVSGNFSPSFPTRKWMGPNVSLFGCPPVFWILFSSSCFRKWKVFPWWLPSWEICNLRNFNLAWLREWNKFQLFSRIYTGLTRLRDEIMHVHSTFCFFYGKMCMYMHENLAGFIPRVSYIYQLCNWHA